MSDFTGPTWPKSTPRGDWYPEGIPWRSYRLFFLFDHSESMRRDANMSCLTYAARQAVASMSEYSHCSLAGVSMWLRTLVFDDRAQWLSQWCDIDHFELGRFCSQGAAGPSGPGAETSHSGVGRPPLASKRAADGRPLLDGQVRR